jgi:hypothetical protein
MLSLDGVEAQLYAPDWEGELPLDRARQKGHGKMGCKHRWKVRWNGQNLFDPVLCFT